MRRLQRRPVYSLFYRYLSAAPRLAGKSAPLHALRSGMCPQIRNETIEFGFTGIGNGPVVHSRGTPVREVITLPLVDMRRRTGIAARPDIQVDRMQLVTVDHHCDCAPVQVIEPATHQRIPLLREI